MPQDISLAIRIVDLCGSTRFLAESDCGFADVDIRRGRSGETRAFGGGTQAGGGRESGTDSGKAYLLQSANTVNYSGDSPLVRAVELGEFQCG